MIANVLINEQCTCGGQDLCERCTEINTLLLADGPTPEKLRQLYINERRSIREIAVELGWKVPRVRRRLLAAGIEMRKRGVQADRLVPDLVVEAIRDLARAGWDPEKIGRVLAQTEAACERAIESDPRRVKGAA